jgi:TRAP-type C4-dicarboxylate transport system permease small subunit
MIRRFNDYATNFLMLLAGFWAFFLGFYICADVTFRNLGFYVQGTNEIVRDSIVMMVFLQIAYCVRIGGMLRADFLMGLMSDGVIRAVNLIGYVLAILFFAAVFYGSLGPAIEAVRIHEFQGDGAVRVPTWPARFSILIGCALVILNYGILIVDEWKGTADHQGSPATH